MNQLLELLIKHFSFLYDEYECRFADSQVYGPDAMLVLESGNLRLRFVRDRSQMFVDFQHKRRKLSNQWYSFGVVRQLVTSDVGGSEELDSEKAEYIRAHFLKIKAAFSSERLKVSERDLANFEQERGERLFGK